ncbi:MAG: Slp family lipoprotein [Thermodesulfobacteriota bacterium]
MHRPPRPCHALTALACVLILWGCAGSRLDASRAEPGLDPAVAAADPERARGRFVHWGGMLVQATNRADGTDLEVLAYPLTRGGEPRTGRAPLGRFLARRDAYLDPAEYAPGRIVTVVGPLEGAVQGRIGEAEYTYPLVRAEQLRLWPAVYPPAEPRFRIGIGAVFGR